MTKHITIRKAPGTWVVRAGGAVLGETANAMELSEGDHEPVIYFPRADVGMAFLEPTQTSTHSPHKGEASYFSIVTMAETLKDAAWSYEAPIDGAAGIKDLLAFAPDRVTVEQL